MTEAQKKIAMLEKMIREPCEIIWNYSELF